MARAFRNQIIFGIVLLMAGLGTFLFTQQTLFVPVTESVWIPQYASLECGLTSVETLGFNPPAGVWHVFCGDDDVLDLLKRKTGDTVITVGGSYPKGCEVKIELIDKGQQITYKKCSLDQEECGLPSKFSLQSNSPDEGILFSSVRPETSNPQTIVLQKGEKVYVKTPSSEGVFGFGGFQRGDARATLSGGKYRLKLHGGGGVQSAFISPNCQTDLAIANGELKFFNLDGVNNTATSLPRVLPPETFINFVTGLSEFRDARNVVYFDLDNDGKPDNGEAVYISEKGFYHPVVRTKETKQLYVDLSRRVPDSRVVCVPAQSNCGDANTGIIQPPLKPRLEEAEDVQADDPFLLEIPRVSGGGLTIVAPDEGGNCDPFGGSKSDEHLPVGDGQECIVDCASGQPVKKDCREQKECPAGKLRDESTGLCVGRTPVPVSVRAVCVSDAFFNRNVVEADKEICPSGIVRGLGCQVGLVAREKVSEIRCEESFGIVSWLLIISVVGVFVFGIVALFVRVPRGGRGR